MTIEEVVKLIVDERIKLIFDDKGGSQEFRKLCEPYLIHNAYSTIFENDCLGKEMIMYVKKPYSSDVKGYYLNYSNHPQHIIKFDLFCKLTDLKLKVDKTPTLKEEIIKVFKKYDKSDLLHYFTLNSEEKSIVNCFKSRNESPKSREILDNWWKDTFYENYLVSNKIWIL